MASCVSGMILYVPRRAARSRIVPSMHENRMESHSKTSNVMMILNPSMFTSLPDIVNYALLINGKYLTNKQMSDNKFLKLASK